MAAKPSAQGVKAAEYLKKNPNEPITASALAQKFDLSISGITRSKYWKEYRKNLESGGASSVDEYTKIVVQVKVENLSAEKYQFELQVSPELLADGDLESVIHSRAARLAKGNRATGVWPKEGQILVWYAQLDDLQRIVNEVSWSPLKASK